MSPVPAATFAEVEEVVADIEGWMTPGQARLLWDCSRAVPAGGTVVEIGSFRGRSMVVLASAAAPGVELVAIDPHAGNDRGPQEINGFEAQAADDHEVFKPTGSVTSASSPTPPSTTYKVNWTCSTSTGPTGWHRHWPTSVIGEIG